MDSALIHRARLLVRTDGARNDQGEKVTSDPVRGPWFTARVMERVGTSKSRRRQDGTDARAPVGYELLANALDENGAPVVLTASSLVETDCGILGSPVLQLDGKPELLNNGEDIIGWDAMATKASDSS